MQRCQLASQRIITRIIRRDKGKEDADRQQLISLFLLFFILSLQRSCRSCRVSFIIHNRIGGLLLLASGCLLHLFPFLIFAWCMMEYRSCMKIDQDAANLRSYPHRVRRCTAVNGAHLIYNYSLLLASHRPSKRADILHTDSIYLLWWYLILFVHCNGQRTKQRHRREAGLPL